MKKDLTTLTLKELEIMMTNARKSTSPNATDVYRAAAVELFRRHGSDYTDPVIADCWGALALLDRCRYEKTGKRLKSQHSVNSIKRNGEIAFMTACARGKTEGTGFVVLVEAGLGQCTVEYIVATNPDRFPPDAVSSARSRLSDHGVPLPTA
ncbi:hypothetical protein WN73_11640 [Bradyrhizobium sp. CCBAU 45394]|uniref:hypothetical protein n=1 Tax=Bradyrhizobium sp. CCBAU 45394 TaxID=1325087 RepID=UPI002302A1DD|nr:hypothetical protein [Bradyrhizobium sp. CCBAU 45394]MDA9391322.1 hypothetical protein [Bradyrhizobium sp. CCBAU 45394]